MPRKKKEREIESGFDVEEPITEVDLQKILEEDEVYGALKEKYFKLLIKEKIGLTLEITSRLDNIEKAINKRKNELLG